MTAIKPNQSSLSTVQENQNSSQVKVVIGNRRFTFEVISTAHDGTRHSLGLNPDELNRVQDLAKNVLQSMNLSPIEISDIKAITKKEVIFSSSEKNLNEGGPIGKARANSIRTTQEGEVGDDGLTAYQRAIVEYWESSESGTAFDIEHSYLNRPDTRAAYPKLFETSALIDEKNNALSALVKDYFPSITWHDLDKTPTEREITPADFRKICKYSNNRYAADCGANATAEYAAKLLFKRISSLQALDNVTTKPTVDRYEGSSNQKDCISCGGHAMSFLVSCFRETGIKAIANKKGIDSTLELGSRIYQKARELRASIPKEDQEAFKDHAQAEYIDSHQALAAANSQGSENSLALKFISDFSTNTCTLKTNKTEDNQKKLKDILAQLKRPDSTSSSRGLMVTTNNGFTYAIAYEKNVGGKETFAIFDSHGKAKAEGEGNSPAYMQVTNDLETAARLLNELTSRQDKDIEVNFIAIEAASEKPTG